MLDPLADPDWGADFVTDDPDEFLRVYWRSQRCAVFVDEAAEVAGQYDRPMIKTATRGRHYGHINHYVCNRGPAGIATTVRDQCGVLFLFTTAFKDAQIHAQEWNRPELIHAPQLPQGCYMRVTRYGELQKGYAFDV